VKEITSRRSYICVVIHDMALKSSENVRIKLCHAGLGSARPLYLPSEYATEKDSRVLLSVRQQQTYY